MASQFELSKVPKRHLKKATIYVERLQKDYWEKYTTFIWNVGNFMKLKDTVVYTNHVQKFDWDLKLKKQGTSATVTVDMTRFGCPLNISCCVLYDESFRSTNTSVRFDAYPISAGLYEMSLPASAIMSKKNCRLKSKGILSIRFHLDEVRRECVHSSRYERDYSRPVNSDLGSVLMKRIMTDFGIKPSAGPVLECHKALLAARSIFFRKYFNESRNNGNEISVSASFDVLCIVVRYLYGIQLDLNKIKEWRSDIFQLTWVLDIPSLKNVCAKLMIYVTDEKVRMFGFSAEKDLTEQLTKIVMPFMMKVVGTYVKNLDNSEQRKQ